GNLPIEWGEDKNIAWKLAIDGKAWSSPVIWGDRIWLTNATEDGTRLAALCVDKNSGKIIHKKRLLVNPAPQYSHPFNSYASPSPVIEQRRVYMSFGSPWTGCLDSETGEVIWERKDIQCNHFRGAGSSPFIYKDLLILHFDGSDHQFVIALDKSTGETVWKTDRSVDYDDIDPETGRPEREGDWRKAFSTPRVIEVEGKDVLLSLGAKALYGYDPATGEELWRLDEAESHSAGTRPVVGQGLVFVPLGSGKGGMIAVRPGGPGAASGPQVVWRYTRVVPKRSSPLLVGDYLFVVDDGGIAACLEAKTGEEVWKARLGGNFSASPILANGKIYFFDEEGKGTVIEAAPEFKILAENELESGCMASPAVSGDVLFVRTKTHLYRIEEEG
ncbi:MAG: PQQ-binding-like beta-propeller repeat protein, partial [Verrucomicrobiales bacterium]